VGGAGSVSQTSRRVRCRRVRDDRAADQASPYLRDVIAGAETAGTEFTGEETTRVIPPGPISGRRPPRPTALIEYILDRTVKGCDPRV
jgi:hypothetical protein